MTGKVPGPMLQPTDWLRHAARHCATAPALLLAEGEFDYANLRSLVAQLCHVLETRGLKPGATIVIESRSATLLAFMLHTALFADYVLCPLDPRLPDGQRQLLLRPLKIDLMIIDDDAVRPHSGVTFMTATELLAGAVQEQHLCEPGPSGSLDDPRLLLASSGSGGVPKLIALSNRNLRANVNAANERLKLMQTSVWLDCLPLVHIGGVSILLRCLMARAMVVLHEGFNTGAVMDALNTRRITHLSLVPAMLAQLLEVNAVPPDSLQVVLIGGAPLDSALANRALKSGWPVWVTYGMTETASMLTARELHGDDDNPQQVGLPLQGFALRIEDELVQVRGEAVQGNRHDDKGSWFSTGDRGRLDEAGRLVILGRMDNMLLSGGEKVDPESVEQLLVNCPGVDEVAVTGCHDALWGDKVVAVYSGDIDEVTFDRLCRESIDGVMRPRKFLKVSSLPRTLSGKLDRAALRELVEHS